MNTGYLLLIIVYGFLAFSVLVTLAAMALRRKQARKVNEQLYGYTVSNCVLCPVCRGWVHVTAWKRHLASEHTRCLHHITPIEEKFEEACKNLSAL